MAAAAAAKSLQSCPTLCDPIDHSPPGSAVPGILQARTLGCHFPLQCMKVKSESEVLQSFLTLCSPMDCSLPGSSIHEIFQARVLEWVAIAFSKHVMNQTKNAYIGIMLRKLMQTHIDKIKQSSIKHIKMSCLGIGCHAWYTLYGLCICVALRWSQNKQS